MPKPLRIGIAGTGFGAAIHLPVLQSLPGVTVTALAGARHDKTVEIARRSGIAVACRTIEELMAQDLDAVTLALPPDLAEPAVELALDRSLAILAEKPLASSAAAAERLARRATGHTAAVDFEFAELDCFRALHNLLARGELGRIRTIDVEWTTRSYADRNRIWSWKTDAARHGGVLTLLGTHVLFLLEWLLGPIVLIDAVADNRATQRFAPSGGVGAADTVSWRGHTAAGAAIAVALCNSAAGSPRHRWTIIGERGSAVLENVTDDPVAGFSLAQVRPNGVTREIISEPTIAGDSRMRPFRMLAERFTAAIRDGTGCQPGFVAGARVQRLVAEIETLASHGHTPLRAAL